MTSTTASDEELVLSKDEANLFELMRDGVILKFEVTYNPSRTLFPNRLGVSNVHAEWSCWYQLGPDMRVEKSYLSALDAFLKARVNIFTYALEGGEIYSPRAKNIRKKLRLS